MIINRILEIEFPVNYFISITKFIFLSQIKSYIETLYPYMYVANRKEKAINLRTYVDFNAKNLFFIRVDQKKYDFVIFAINIIKKKIIPLKMYFDSHLLLNLNLFISFLLQIKFYSNLYFYILTL